MTGRFRALVLAGERPGSALAAQLGVPAAVLAQVGGVPMLDRVLGALGDAHCVDGGLVVGPRAEVVAAEGLTARLEAQGFGWHAPEDGPAASVLAGYGALATDAPVLVTTADHALLRAPLVERFCADALASGADFAVGLARHADVMAALPGTRRTALRFADGHRCGCNLFAVLRPQGLAAVRLWRQVEAHRKQPWRVMRLLGSAAVARYLAGRLTTEDALARLSAAAGCRVLEVPVADGLAAVDVDSVADWEQANALLAAATSATPL